MIGWIQKEGGAQRRQLSSRALSGPLTVHTFQHMSESTRASPPATRIRVKDVTITLAVRWLAAILDFEGEVAFFSSTTAPDSNDYQAHNHNPEDVCMVRMGIH